MDEPDPRTSPVALFWDDLLADREAMAAEYREDGWETIELNPGDVTPIPEVDHDRFGLDVLVPGEEYAAVREAVEDPEAGFEGSEVYARTVEGVVLLIAVELDPGTETAVFVPLFYRPEEARPLFERANERGELRTHIRRLDRDEVLTFQHDDPSVFRPAEGNADDRTATDRGRGPE